MENRTNSRQANGDSQKKKTSNSHKGIRILLVSILCVAILIVAGVLLTQQSKEGAQADADAEAARIAQETAERKQQPAFSASAHSGKPFRSSMTASCIPVCSFRA